MIHAEAQGRWPSEAAQAASSQWDILLMTALLELRYEEREARERAKIPPLPPR